jgi:hypothetical protein
MIEIVIHNLPQIETWQFRNGETYKNGESLLKLEDI